MSEAMMKRLIDHAEGYAGSFVGAEPRLWNSASQLGHLLYFENTDNDMCTVISHGIQQLETAEVPFGEEVACSLKRSQVMYARHLVDAACRLVLKRGIGFEFGDVIEAHDDVLIEETDMAAVLVSDHPYLDEEFIAFRDEDGDVHAQVICLLPITQLEKELLARHGRDALGAVWTAAKPDLLDIDRSCTVPSAERSTPRSSDLREGAS